MAPSFTGKFSAKRTGRPRAAVNVAIWSVLTCGLTMPGPVHMISAVVGRASTYARRYGVTSMPE